MAEVLDDPRHPYTAGLLGSIPSRNQRGQQLRQIPGMTPSILSLPKGCAFRTRCPRADEACFEVPLWVSEGARAHRCVNPVQRERA